MRERERDRDICYIERGEWGERERQIERERELRELRERDIYICCEFIIWAKFGHFRCYYLGRVGVIIWAKLFFSQ